MSKLFKIITLGCKVNQYESAFIEESLINVGCEKVAPDGESDLVIINGCIVTARASYQTKQAVRRSIRENPEAIIAVIGCYGQVFPEELSKIDGVDFIAGNRGKSALPELLVNATHRTPPLIVRDHFEDSQQFEEIPIKRFSGRTRAFLKIQDGCESFCSYCIVPMARGPLRSLASHKVIEVLRDLVIHGYKEVVLTGIHLGKYGADFGNGKDLAHLLQEIGREGFPLRIRLSSLEPTEIDSELIEFMTSQDWLCRHFHISLQSGDDSILKSMNRNYTPEMCTRLLHDIHHTVPQVCIGVDVLAGFPGETDRAFSNTFDLLKDLPVSYLHVFPYSRRDGTAAAQFSDHLDHKTINERALLLRSLDREKRKGFRYSLIGHTFDVLAEGWEPGERNLIRGLSDNYVRFTFPSKRLITNGFVKVRAEAVTEKGMMATQIQG